MQTPAGLPDIQCLLAPNPSVMTGAGTTTFLVRGRRSGCAVIDPGPLIESHLVTIVQRAADWGGVAAILLTHSHPDHSAGVERLRQLTSAPVIAWSPANQSDAEWQIDVAGRNITAIHTPGHCPDHLCFWLADNGTLFAGDLVAGEGTVVIAPPEGDMAAYLASLRRIDNLPLQRILPAHGPLIDRPHDLLRQYIAHRLQREEQVLAALRQGPATPDGLVPQVYGALDPALAPLAALSLTAHLINLEVEGRVIRLADTLWQVSPD